MRVYISSLRRFRSRLLYQVVDRASAGCSYKLLSDDRSLSSIPHTASARTRALTYAPARLGQEQQKPNCHTNKVSGGATRRGRTTKIAELGVNDPCDPVCVYFQFAGSVSYAKIH